MNNGLCNKLFDNDIRRLDKADKNAIVSPNGALRWPNAQIPYVISVEYCIYYKRNIFYHIILNILEH